jgi:hypothetical protein
MAKKYTDEQVAEAKLLFMKDIPISEISDSSGMTRASLYYYVKGGWKEEKDLQGAELFRELASSKKETFVKMIRSSQNIVQKYLSTLENQTVVDSKDVKVAVQVLSELDKITRLDDANPDDGLDNKEKPITTADLVKRLKADPFASVEKK